MKKIVLAMLAVGLLALGGQAATSGASVKTASAMYVVKSGDTLSSIAARYGTTVSAIAKANGISNPNRIVIGRTLNIPAAASAPKGLPAKLQAHPDRVALRPTFEKWAAHYGVPANVLEALAWVESGWQSNVVSRTGAVGIGQLQPATVDLVRIKIGIPTLDPYNPSDNIRMSAWFVRYLLDSTGGDTGAALSAYYQGLRSVRMSPVLAETRQYVATVQAYIPYFS